MLELFNGFSLNRQVLQLPISVSSYIPGSSCFVLRLHRALKQLERRSRARKRNAGRHTFLNVPCIHTHPASFACRCAHTHTQESHIPSLFPLRSCRPRPTPTPSLSPRRRCSGSVIQPASTYCSRRITQITPLAIAMVSASLSYLFKVSYDPFHSCTGFLSS